MISYKKLWAVQLEEYPNSVRIKPYHILFWSNSGDRLRKLSSLANATQFPRVLFYITDPNGGYIGGRFGLEGHQYISGFNGYKVKLVKDELVDTKDF
jgi:hypothetical protein